MRDYKTSVVILMYNKFNLTDKLLMDLARHEPDLDEVLVVNNGSTEDVHFGLEGWSRDMSLPMSYVTIVKNVGFVEGFNYGLKLVTKGFAEKRIVFAISNDVRVHGKFVDQTAEHLMDARRALVGNRHIAFDSGWNTFDNKTFDYLEGWFLAATADGWRDLGYFDKAFAPMDYEDIDLSTTAKTKGYKLVSLNNPNLIHQGAGTYGYTEERRIQTEKNREVFRKKWLGE